MLVIRITVGITSDDIVRLSDAWKNNKSVALEMPPDLSKDEWIGIYDSCSAVLETDLSVVIMANLAEYKCAPMELLKKIFEVGDIACKETVCMRDDLTVEIQSLCLEYGPEHIPPY